jgi:hypothetical protein
MCVGEQLSGSRGLASGVHKLAFKKIFLNAIRKILTAVPKKSAVRAEF